MEVKSVDKLPPRNISIYNTNQLYDFRTTQIITERHTQTKYNNFFKILKLNHLLTSAILIYKSYKCCLKMNELTCKNHRFSYC